MPETHEAKNGPLAGIEVLEFAGLAPVSIAGLTLSSLGADVIRVDRLSHDADGADNSLRRGRRSIVLNLKSERGSAAARRLAERADILIEGYRPGVMERLGLGPDAFVDTHPGLIYGRLTGWGQDGPASLTAGHDITYLALTGALHSIGPAGSPPVPPVNYVADIGSGTMLLLLGVLAALQERSVSGLGQVVDAAMVDGVPLLAATVLRALERGEWSDDRGTNLLDGGAPFYRCYECADGRFVAVGAIEPAFYSALLRALDLEPSSVPEQWDRARWPELAELLAARIAERSRDDWAAATEGTDACLSPVLTFGESARHPHVRARGALIDDNGTLYPGPAPKLSRTVLAQPGPAPGRGQHTAEVLREAGVPLEEIDDLLTSGDASSPRT